ncbi:MAG: hypothetical protein QF492_08700 [Candidatus Krumholzibacteria bacterium]|jgi:ornithine carbamoyltransferase|nr:hypothetical protein [Candidatus Krumholzibacteria bacterium]MDP6669966.1 hypothetical protein [Candidatus Krumholzibacteria bacterium]MDP6797854.1 hypothetical protein [Candidatus Krumholzibacteria bacterium]MDP7021279.1 hypothetical protein [Candidatus Krumholzibacteria bacterium]
MFIKGRHLLSLSDLDNQEINELIDFALELKARFLSGESTEFMSGGHLYLFDPESLMGAWDPVSLAFENLGGRCHRVKAGGLREDWGETWRDRIQLLSRSAHGLAMASADPEQGHAFLEESAQLSRVPVINMMSERAAPLQAMASLMAVQGQKGPDLENLRAALLWAPPGIRSRPPSLPFSLLEILLRKEIAVTLACPASFQPGLEVQDAAGEISPTGFTLCEDPSEAIEDADLVFSMNWDLDYQNQDFEEIARIAGEFSSWMLNEEMLALAAPDALFGGMLPKSRDTEIEAKLLEHPRSIHLEESSDLLHVARAVLALSMDLQTPEEDRVMSDEARIQ